MRIDRIQRSWDRRDQTRESSIKSTRSRRVVLALSGSLCDLARRTLVVEGASVEAVVLRYLQSDFSRLGSWDWEKLPWLGSGIVRGAVGAFGLDRGSRRDPELEVNKAYSPRGRSRS